MTFCSSSKVAVFSLLTIDVDLCLNMSEDLNQIYCRRSLDMNSRSIGISISLHSSVYFFTSLNSPFISLAHCCSKFSSIPVSSRLRWALQRACSHSYLLYEPHPS